MFTLIEKRWAAWACLALLAMAAGTMAALPATPSGGLELSFPSAGVTVALPAGYALQPVTGEFDVFRAVHARSDGQAEAAVTLAIMPVQADVKLEKFVESVMAERSLAVRSLESLKSEAVTLAGQPGAWRRIQYTFRGEPAVADRLLAVYDPGLAGAAPAATQPATARATPGNYKLGFLVTIEARPDTSQRLLDDTRAAVLATLKLGTPRRPADVPLVLTDKPIEQAGLGMSLRLPVDWKVQHSAGQLKAYQIDYTQGGVPYPMLTVVRLAAPAGATGKSVIEQSLTALQKAFPQSKIAIAEEGPAKLDGADGYAALFTVAHDGQTLACAHRCVVRGGYSQTVSLTLQNDPPAKAQAMLDTLAGAMKFVDVPTTGPATEAKP